MGDRSTEKLVEALVSAGAPAGLVEKARASVFHDFKSESATPIVNLVLECEAAGLTEIANQARNGAFDATKLESDEWASSEDGQAAMKTLTE